MARGSLVLIIVVAIAVIQVDAKGVDMPEVPGWNFAGEALVFDAESIWKAINGAAGLYLAYGFQLLQVRDYSHGKQLVTVSIYDMGSPLNAFGIYRRERPTKSEALDTGVESLVSPTGQCLMFKERYYVRVEARRGKLDRTICKEFMRALAAALPGGNEYPAELKALPARGQASGSVGYTRRSYLGLSELKNCLHAVYTRDDGKEFQLFMLVPEGEQTAKAVWEKLTGEWKRAQGGSLPVLVKNVPYRGVVSIALRGQKIYGVAGVDDADAALNTLQWMIGQAGR